MTAELLDLIVLFIAFLLALSLVRYPVAAAQGTAGKNDPVADREPVRMATDVVRFGTFNIHGGRGRDGRTDLARIAEDLRAAQVDVAALQEVHNSWQLRNQPARLARKLGYASLDSPIRWYLFRKNRSNVLLSRFPIGAWSCAPLAHQPTQQQRFRNLTIATIDVDGQPIQVIFTHLQRGHDPSSDGRLDQLREALDLFLAQDCAIFMGDLNTRRTELLLTEVLRRPDVTDAISQFLINDHPRRIDWILCRGVTVTRAGRLDSGASDHPLYWCDVRVPGRAESEREPH